ASFDHRRELAREDLERLRLDLLEHAAETVFARSCLLGEAARQEPSRLQLLTRARDVRRADDAGRQAALRIYCVVCEFSHARPPTSWSSSSWRLSSPAPASPCT